MANLTILPATLNCEQVTERSRDSLELIPRSVPQCQQQSPMSELVARAGVAAAELGEGSSPGLPCSMALAVVLAAEPACILPVHSISMLHKQTSELLHNLPANPSAQVKEIQLPVLAQRTLTTRKIYGLTVKCCQHCPNVLFYT